MTSLRARARALAARPRARGLVESVGFGFLGKATGFLVPIVVAAGFGVSRQTDGLFLAMAVVQSLVLVWGAVVEQVGVPLLAEVAGRNASLAREGWIRRRAVVGAIASWIVAGGALAGWLTLTARATLGDTMLFYALLGPQLWIAAAVAPAAAFLVARGEYRWSALSSGLRALGVLCLYLVAPRALGLVAIAAGYSAGELLRAMVLHVRAGKRRALEPVPGTVPVDPAAGTAGRGAHQLAGNAMAGVGPVVERSIAASLGAGAVTRLDYASKLFYVPSMLFDLNTTSVFLSEWSRIVAAGEWDRLRHDVRVTIARVLALATAIAVVVVLAREPIVRLLLARGAFAPSEVAPVAHLLAVLMAAFPFSAAGVLLAGAYVALGESRFFFGVSAAKMAFRLSAAVTLGPWLGVTGLAIAFVGTHVLECGIFLLNLDRAVARRADRAIRESAAAPAAVSV